MACRPPSPPEPPADFLPRPGSAPQVPAEPRTTAPDAGTRAYRTCPVCGADLADRSCKLRCETPGCGYYLSCSDFY